jgi:hypothetical protein
MLHKEDFNNEIEELVSYNNFPKLSHGITNKQKQQ